MSKLWRKWLDHISLMFSRLGAGTEVEVKHRQSVWGDLEAKVKSEGLKLAIIEIGAGVHIPTVRYRNRKYS